MIIESTNPIDYLQQIFTDAISGTNSEWQISAGHYVVFVSIAEAFWVEFLWIRKIVRITMEPVNWYPESDSFLESEFRIISVFT